MRCGARHGRLEVPREATPGGASSGPDRVVDGDGTLPWTSNVGGATTRSRLQALIATVGMLSAGPAGAQSASLEGHIFNKRTGVPIEGAAVVVHENVTLGLVPILLAEGLSDGNGFYQFAIDTVFPVGVILVFCRTPSGVVVQGMSSAPLEDHTIRRRDIYLETPRFLQRCLAPEPGDIPPFRR